MAWLTARGAEWSRVVGTVFFGLYVLASICWLISVADPLPEDVAGYTAYLERYRAGIAVEAAAVAAL